MQERNVPLPITLGLLLTVAVGVGIVMKSKEYIQLVPNFPATAEAAASAQSTFATWSARSWHYTALAERDIQELDDGQRIMDGIIVDPVDGAIAYFATSSFAVEDQDMTLSIYRYDMQNLTFTRLYRAVYEKGQSRYLGKNTWPLWRVIGYDHERLVVLLQDVDYAYDTCDAPLLVGIEKSASAVLLTLSLDDPSAGLTPYVTQETDVTAAREARETCRAE